MGLKISTNKSQRAEVKSKKKLEMLQFLIKRLIVLAFDQRQIPESIKDAISSLGPERIISSSGTQMSQLRYNVYSFTQSFKPDHDSENYAIFLVFFHLCEYSFAISKYSDNVN